MPAIRPLVHLPLLNYSIQTNHNPRGISSSSATEPMNSIPVALQLWSLNEACRSDFRSTVKAVAEIGYRAVELAGYGNLDAARATKALDEAGLVTAGMHVGLGRLRVDLSRVIDDARLFGAKHVICPSWPKAEYTSEAACRKIGQELDSIGADFRRNGIAFSFHNHAPEFGVVDGRRVIDWMLDASDTLNLGCELDVYWAQIGGTAPSEFIRERSSRIRLVHLKDETELGLGPVRFPDVFSAVERIGGVEWYIVEQERYNRAPLESVRICFAQLQAWGLA